MRLSIIIATGRVTDDVRACVDSLLRQDVPFEFEIILCGSPVGIEHENVRAISVEDLNPALRRNRAAATATGEILGFIDDDATAAEDWMLRGVRLLEGDREVVAAGGPDPAPADSTIAELFADTLLAAPWIGSGVLCHEGPSGMRDVKSAHDLALVNLFVRRQDFADLGGFDETIGYVGEDSELLARLIERGRVVYNSGLVVYHRRRAFPAEYVRQRWRYRVKMGESLLRPGSVYRSSTKIWIFLAGGLLFAGSIILAPKTGILLFLLYVVASLIAGTSATRLPMRWWPLIPFAFMVHHGTYFAGITWGLARGIARRNEPAKTLEGTKNR